MSLKTHTEYQELQQKKQLDLLLSGFFGKVEGNGCWWDRDSMSWKTYPHILTHKDSIANLYAPIRQEVLDYFESNDISWWRQDEDRYFPTGHMLSSQNHCLNHLFAIRRDKIAIMSIIKALCPQIKDILPSPIDNSIEIKDGNIHRFKSYITFEFTCANHELLKESGEKRGKKCTSVDAFIYAIDKDDRKILIPIEWKYTEAYNKEKRAHQKSIDRYVKYANLESSNLKLWISDYEWDPLYEFARQEILIEQIIRKHPLVGFGYKKMPLMADDFVHIIVRPSGNTEIVNDIADFRETLVDNSKLIDIDPQDLLAPLKGNDKYADLLDYLQKRYW